MEFDLQIVNRHFPDLTETQTRQLSKFSELIAYWNQRVNLISRNDIQNLPMRHILHSLAIAKTVDFQPGTRILDVGTGGGFPGIPLAIIYPECQFQLIDSVGKKIKAVSNCIESLDLDNAVAHQARAETVRDTFDFIVARAVTQLPKFLGWIRDRVRHPSAKRYGKRSALPERRRSLGRVFRGPGNAYLYPIVDYFKYPEFDNKFVVHIPIASKTTS